jgi:PAS domain S-box-containing protein
MDKESAKIIEELIQANESLREQNQQLLSEIAEKKQIEEALAESEAHFRTLADNGQALIWTSGTDKNCNYFNQPWLDFTGRTLKQEIGNGWTEGLHPEDFDYCLDVYIKAFDLREKFSMEYRVHHNSGEYRWIQDNGTPRFNRKGEFLGYIGHCLDINERKLMDIELQENKKLFSKAEAIGHVGSWEYNIQTTKFWGSDEAKRIYGFDPAKDVFSTEEIEACIPEHERVHQALIELIEEGKKYKLEFKIITKNTAENKTILSIAELGYDGHGIPQSVVGVIQDITSRKKAEEALLKSENRFRSFVENANDVVYSLSLKGVFTYVSPNWVEILGHEVNEVVGQSIGNFIHPDDMQACQVEVMQAITIGKKQSGIEYRVRHKDGTWRWHTSNTSTIRDKNGEITLLMGIAHDITDRKQVEIALKNSEERLQLIMDVTKTGFWDWNLEKDQWYASPMYYTMLGYEPIKGLSDRKIWVERIHPDDRIEVSKKIDNVLSGNESGYTYECRMLHANGSYHWLSVQGHVAAYSSTGKPARMLGTRIDISERKYNEELLCRLNRELKAISSCNQLLIHSENEQTLLNDVCNIIYNEAGYRFVWIGFIENNEEKIVSPTAWAGHEEGYLSETKITWSEDSKYGLGPTGRAIREKKLRYIQDIVNDTSFSPWKEYAFKRDYKSMISMPLLDGAKNAFGVMNIYSSEKNAFTDSEIRLLNELSEDLAFGVSSLRLQNTHKLIEETLFESEEKYRNLVETSMDAIYINQGKIITYLNPAALKLFGAKNPEQIIGKTPFDIIHPDYHDLVKNRIKILVNDRIPASILEEKVVQLNGNIIDVEVAASPFSFKGEQVIQVVMRDISERKRFEKSLIESKALYHSFVEHLPASVFRKDAEGRYVFVNTLFCKLKGLSAEEIIGRTPTELSEYGIKKGGKHPLGIMGAQYNLDNMGTSQHEQMMKTGVPIEQVEEYPQPDSTTLYFQVIKSPVFDTEGKVIGSQGVMFDITERMLAEEQVRESERLLNESQRISGIGSYTLNISREMWHSSIVLDEMFGIDPSDDHSIDGWLAVIHPDDRDMMNNYFFNDVIGQKSRFDKEYRIIPKNSPSTIKWVHGIGELELDTQEMPTKMIGTIQDITERKKTEDELLKLTRAIEQSPDTIVITNTKGEIEYANPTIEEKTGYSLSELVGKNPRIFASGHTTKNEYTEMWKTISSGQIWQGEFLNKKKNGELFWESSTISPVYDNKCVVTHYLAIKEDITQQKKMTEELIEAKEKAEESDRLKSAFLANMSHEIRTPLNSILGFASLMPDEKSLDLISNYAQIVVQNSEQLVSLIDGIVLYSKLQSHLMSYQPVLFNAGKLLRDVQVSFALPEYNKAVELRTEICGEIQIFSDYDKIRQILTNLVSNAFKYTKGGLIIIGCESNTDEVKFWVKDTGIGIPDKERAQIFDRFFRGSNVDLVRSRGTGIGLSIVKELIELLNGKIWVESEVGKGSTFYFTMKKTDNEKKIQ